MNALTLRVVQNAGAILNQGLGTSTATSFKVSPAAPSRTSLVTGAQFPPGSSGTAGRSWKALISSSCKQSRRVCPLQVESTSGVRYKYYFSTAVTATVTSGALTLSAPFTGVMRVAVLRSGHMPIIAYDDVTALLVEQLYDSYAGAARARVLGLSWAVLYMLCCPDRLHCVMICGGYELWHVLFCLQTPTPPAPPLPTATSPSRSPAQAGSVALCAFASTLRRCPARLPWAAT